MQLVEVEHGIPDRMPGLYFDACTYVHSTPVHSGNQSLLSPLLLFCLLSSGMADRWPQKYDVKSPQFVFAEPQSPHTDRTSRRFGAFVDTCVPQLWRRLGI